MSLSLNSLSEYSQTDGTFFHSATLVNGGWQEVNDTRYNATRSFVYAASLGFSNGAGNLTLSGTVELQFFVFDQDALLSVGPGLLPFTVSPSLAKFSLKVTDWPWEGREDHALEVRMDITPEYNRSERFDSSPQAGLTTFKLFGQYPLNPDTITQIRVVEAVEIDGVVLDQGGVDYRIDRGQLLMQFDHFTSYFLYDPDVGVLLGASGGEQDSVSDNTALIVSLSVILPVAAIVVILVGAAVLVAYLKREKLRASTSAIDIGEEHM